MRCVIVAARRTGSNWLCTLLDSHPEILCHHEIFNPAGIFYAQSLRHTGFALGSTGERDADPLEFIDRIWGDSRGNACVGFKMTHGQAEAVLERVLTDARVRKIVLTRRNRVKTCVSEKLAEKLDQWEAYDTADLSGERPRVVIDVGELREHAARNEAFYQRLNSVLADAGQTALPVCYEELGRAAEHERLLRFLDVSPGVALEPRSVKQNPRDLRESIENFDELSEALRGDPLRDELLDEAS